MLVSFVYLVWMDSSCGTIVTSWAAFNCKRPYISNQSAYILNRTLCCQARARELGREIEGSG